MTSISSQVTALYVSGKGNTNSLLLERLSNKALPPRATRIMLTSHTTPSVAQEMLDHGCIGWHILAKSQSCPSDAAEPLELSDGPFPATAVPSFALNERLANGDWLTHCTRRRVGPWPNQASSDYLDQLLFEEAAANRSALAAMEQIVTQQQLIASNEGIRGDAAVVCFTAVPLSELDNLRVFRPHRGRWDFQPYGVCIAREWLRRHGARPVCYALGDDWEKMSKPDRAFFQVERSWTRSGKEIDWTVEEEWRIPGDIELSKIPHDQIFVFVPTEAEGARLQQLTDWTVVRRFG